MRCGVIGRHLTRSFLVPRNVGDKRGVTLVEVLLAAALVAVLLGLALPLLTTGRDAVRLLGAARYLASQVAWARSLAVRRGGAVGLRFVPGADGYLLRAYADGNANGVRQADITRGIDEPLGPDFRIGDRFPGVRLALDEAVPPIGGGGGAGADADPVRLGGGETLTVSPLGTTTSGTIYLQSRGGRQAAVRVLGATGRVRVWTFESGGGGWRSR